MRRCSVPLAGLVPLLVVLAGCGSSAAKPFPPDLEARAVAERYGYAVKSQAWGTICREYLAPRLRANVEQLGVPCEQALARALGDVRAPTLEVVSSRVSGAVALVRVRTGAEGQKESIDVLEVVRQRDGSWRIADLDA